MQKKKMTLQIKALGASISFVCACVCACVCIRVCVCVRDQQFSQVPGTLLLIRSASPSEILPRIKWGPIIILFFWTEKRRGIGFPCSSHFVKWRSFGMAALALAPVFNHCSPLSEQQGAVSTQRGCWEHCPGAADSWGRFRSESSWWLGWWEGI